MLYHALIQSTEPGLVLLRGKHTGRGHHSSAGASEFKHEIK